MTRAKSAAKAPAKPPGPPALKRDNGFRYAPKFGVIVLCETELDQRSTYDRLHAAGHACKVVTV